MYFQIASIETTAKEINVRANGTSLRKFPNNTTVVNLSPVQTRPEKFNFISTIGPTVHTNLSRSFSRTLCKPRQEFGNAGFAF